MLSPSRSGDARSVPAATSSGSQADASSTGSPSSVIRRCRTNALAPAQLKTFDVDDTNRRVKIVVSEDQLSLAIGKKGQNARLTSRLTGWEINIDKDTSATTAVEQKVAQAAQALAGALPITEEQAMTLVKSGFTNLEGLRDADVKDLVEILSVEETKAQEIHDAVHREEDAPKAGSA